MLIPNLSQILTGPPIKVHLIGVAGSGISGIAHRPRARPCGERIQTRPTPSKSNACEKGLDFYGPHRSTEVEDKDLVIYSSAIKPGNPAFDAARALDKPMARRADALAAIMAAKKGIVVCGMHGKTTTSSMAAHVLRIGGVKPSHYVGAESPILGTNARWDSEGEFFVAEGDESDGTLITYHPEHAIVLNIEPEHLDFYKDLAAIDAVYAKLISQTRGKVIYCADDEGAAGNITPLTPAIPYGRLASAAYRLRRSED